MVCRRNDRARFVGCHVGSVRIRGCDRDCCPYPDNAIEENERLSYPRSHLDYNPHYSSIDRTLAPSKNHTCRSRYRPKFACLTCRRAFKPAFIEGNQYVIWDRYRPGWWWAPLPHRIPSVWAEYRQVSQLPARRKEYAQLIEMRGRVDSGVKLTKEELGALKQRDPELWWKPLNASRCGGCGGAGVSIGGAFRAPAQNDGKAWVEVRRMLEAGELFSYCMTQDEEIEVQRNAELAARRQAMAESWFAEKRRRIEELKEASRMSGRTCVEQQRLTSLRVQKEVESSWVLV